MLTKTFILVIVHFVIQSLSQSEADWKKFIELTKPDCDWLATKTPPIKKDLSYTYNEAVLLEKCFVWWLSFKEAINETTQSGNFTSWKSVLAQPPIHWKDDDNYYGINLTVSDIYLHKVDSGWQNSIYLQLYAIFRWTDSRLSWKNDKYFSTEWKQLRFDQRYMDDSSSPKIWFPKIFVINSHPWYSEMIEKYRGARVNRDGTVNAYFRIEAPGDCILDYKNYPTDDITCSAMLFSYEKGLSFHNGTVTEEPKTRLFADWEKQRISKDYDLVSMTTSIFPARSGPNANNYGISIKVNLTRRSDIKWIEMFSPLCVSVVLTLAALAYPNRKESLWLKLTSLLILVVTVIGIGHSNNQLKFAHSTPRVLRAYQLVIALTLISIITTLIANGAKESLKKSTAPYMLKSLAAVINRFGCAVHAEQTEDTSLISDEGDVFKNDYTAVFSALHVLMFYILAAIMLIGVAVVFCY